MRYYFYHPYGKGGAHTTQILNAELQRLNVQRIGRIEITDLVKDGDAVSGAVGFHAQSGTPCLFRAKAVILAAHNGGWKGSYLLNTCAGEGAALAYGAGASLRNMEFIENWNVPKLFAWEGQTGMLPYGARFLNGEGEDFMRRYSPKLGAKADPHYNVRGMAFEVRAGRGPIYFDTSTMSPEGVEIMTPTGGWMKLNDTKLKELGIHSVLLLKKSMPSSRSFLSLRPIQPALGRMVSTSSGFIWLQSKRIGPFPALTSCTMPRVL